MNADPLPLARRITQDPVEIRTGGRILTNHFSGYDIATFPLNRREEAEAHCELLAEAITVAHETGKTPRQLADTLEAFKQAHADAWAKYQETREATQIQPK